MKQDFKSSEAVFQILFAFEMSGHCDEELISVIMQQLELSKRKTKELFDKACLVWQQHKEIDKIITERSKDYDFDRIGLVEKSILRVTLFEMEQDKEKPLVVWIKEAMRLAKKFSTPHAAKYVNAILDPASSA